MKNYKRGINTFLGILIAVILAIAMVIGVLILTVGLVYIKRWSKTYYICTHKQIYQSCTNFEVTVYLNNFYYVKLTENIL